MLNESCPSFNYSPGLGLLEFPENTKTEVTEFEFPEPARTLTDRLSVANGAHEYRPYAAWCIKEIASKEPQRVQDLQIAKDQSM